MADTLDRETYDKVRHLVEAAYHAGCQWPLTAPIVDFAAWEKEHAPPKPKKLREVQLSNRTAPPPWPTLIVRYDPERMWFQCRSDNVGSGWSYLLSTQIRDVEHITLLADLRARPYVEDTET